MNRMSLPLALRAGFLLLSTGLLVLLWEGESTAGIPVDASDPDEAFVAQTGKPVGKLSFQIIDDTSHVSLPARLYFAYADGREEDPVVKDNLLSGAGEMVILKQLPDGLEVGLGCVSCRPGVVDSVEAIIERVESALRYLSPEQITLNPDCGFAPGSAAVVEIDEVYAKLKNEAEAAARLREKYS